MGRFFHTRRWRRAVPGLCGLPSIAVALAFLAQPLVGQELTLKRTLPDPSPGGCAVLPTFAPASPPDADGQEADRLASAASQAAILGDREGALDFLERAADLDPTDDGIAYELARTYEALGRTTDAVVAYCKFLVLAPASPDARDVRASVLALNPPDTPLSPQAQLAFARGVDAVDADDMDDAGREFTTALTAEPSMALAYYNRALAYSADRRYELAIEDFRRYLDLAPEASDADQVLERIGTLRNPPAVYNPSTALVAGAFIPGFGQFHTDRPVGGLTVLTLAAAAAGFGIAYTETEITCATPANPCPPSQIIDETSTQPLLVPGLVTAAAITIGAAIEGYLTAKRRNAEATSVGGQIGQQSGPTLLPPAVGATADGRVALQWVRLRF